MAGPLDVLRRLEARGEIRGGRFVSGFLGEQFAGRKIDLLRVEEKSEETPLRIAAYRSTQPCRHHHAWIAYKPLAAQAVELLVTA
jgi:hypothetical protein